jgi:hypothetical protein
MWYTPVIPALVELKQEGHEFKASLGYTAKPCPKNQGVNLGRSINGTED